MFLLGLGNGLYPYHDPWGRSFTKDYCKSRWALRGQPIAGGYRAILEGIQGDQDFIRILFSPCSDWNWFWFELFTQQRIVQKLYGIFSKIDTCVIFPNVSWLWLWFNPRTDFGVCFPRHVRILLTSILLLLLQSCSMGLQGWKPGVGWVLVHKFWATSTPQGHVPKLCLRVVFIVWCSVPAKHDHDMFFRNKLILG